MAGSSSFSMERESPFIDLLQKLREEHTKELDKLRQEMELELQAKHKELLDIRKLLNRVQSYQGANHEDHEDREVTQDMHHDLEEASPPTHCTSDIVGHPDEAIQRHDSRGSRDGARQRQLEEIKAWAKKHPDKRAEEIGSCQQKMLCLVQSTFFETCCTGAILFNVVLMGMSVDHVAKHESDPDNPPKVYNTLDHVFCAWFVLELVCRLTAFRCKFLHMEGWAWNVFDLVVVSTDVMQTGIELFAMDTPAMNSMSVLRTLRVLRITRALRVLRFVHLFRELRLMVASLMHSGPSLMWSMLLFASVIYMFAVLLSSPVNYQVYSNRGDKYYANYRQYWSSIPQAMWTLFGCMTGGISWNDVADPLVHIHPVWGFLIGFFMFFTIFALANIVTGIFVDGAIQKAESNRDEMVQQDMAVRQESLEVLKTIFEAADSNKSGTLTYDEFETHLENSSTQALLDAVGIHVDEAKSLFNLVDTSESNEVSIEDFIFGFMRLKGYATSIHLASFNIEYRKNLADIKKFHYYVAQNIETLREQLDSLLAVRGQVISKEIKVCI